MTEKDLDRGIELREQMEKLDENIAVLNYVLKRYDCKIKKFFLGFINKNKIRINAEGYSSNGYLTVDRECMELIKSYFENKLKETRSEFKSIGKGGEG